MDCLKNITSADVIRTIQNAETRIVFLAPGIDEATADALAAVWERLGPEGVTVILDIDAEVVRLGYGTQKALEKIQEAAACLGQAVCHQPGVRICVVVADESTLIFAPTPLLIEAGATQVSRPNGISLSMTPQALGDELGIGKDGNAGREIGLEPMRMDRLEAVKKDLEDNPPLKFDISRKERIFNARLEFVEFELEGCFISRHTVQIPSELVGMAKMDKQTRNKLRSSFRLIEDSDTFDKDGQISERALRDERTRIGRKFLRPVKGFGILILRSNREAFEAEVEGLREKVGAFRDALRKKLVSIYEENALRLTEALLPAVISNPPENWIGSLGLIQKPKVIEKMLHQTLLRSFGDPELLLREMRVNLNFKGVTYGTLMDEKFVEEAGEVFPHLTIHEEYDAARGHDAAAPVQNDLFAE